MRHPLSRGQVTFSPGKEVLLEASLQTRGREELAELISQRSIAVARAVMGPVLIAYSLSTGFGGLDAPAYARTLGAVAGAVFLISGIAELMSGEAAERVRRRLVILDVMLVTAVMFAFIEDPTSYEYILVGWVVVEVGTVFDVRRTLAVAGFLAVAYVVKEWIAWTRFDQMVDAGGSLVRVATVGAIGLVTSSYATAIQSKRLLVEERDRSSQLEELDEAKTMFIRAVAHDLKSPLAVVTGMADLLVNRGDTMAPEQRAQLSKTILKNGRKLESLVTDLMDAERLSQGVLQLERTETDCADLVRRAIEDVDMKDRPVELDLEPAIAVVDGPKMERVIENLLANAAKHTPPRTQVWVRVVEEGGAVTIAVADAGDGIPEAQRDAVFEAFVQGTPNAPGTGVGLSLVRGIARLHGGDAWVEERDGGGAAFFVRVPSSGA